MSEQQRNIIHSFRFNAQDFFHAMSFSESWDCTQIEANGKSSGVCSRQRAAPDDLRALSEEPGRKHRHFLGMLLHHMCSAA
jgi:hypothetical protein